MEQTDFQSIFTSPFCKLTTDALLQHFQTRTTVHYFPVPDMAETAQPKIDDIFANRFEFSSDGHQLSSSSPWLTNPGHDQKWQTLLHTFHYAVRLGMAYHKTDDPRYAEQWVALTSSWIQTVPFTFLPSDVTGRRVQNWIFAHFYFVSTRQPHCVTPDFYRDFLQSLHSQIVHLRDQVTAARSHWTPELCAIFWAAVVFPEFKESTAWLTWSRTELLRNIQSDLQPDCDHDKQSTDYHNSMLKSYLWIKNLARLNQIDMPEEFDHLVKKALQFSRYYHRADNMIPPLSDSNSRSF